ncbi:peptidoglycan editing factor PgeF [Yoonia sp. 2307UL14-13]|uniref:peptidoglycan editing factor PgeF n=1 Tax=Yoonia sp. 2307UL14-13 TaxID=3126506 RepID=UPI0030AB3FBF
MTLDIITDSALSGIRHGFFGRAGGASSGVFKGLNCGYGSSDQHDIVTINRERVAKAMGVTPDNMIGVHQIHSAEALIVRTPRTDLPKADALVTKTRGLVLSVLTADCQPVLFADPKTGVIGAAHAGWKGALHGVLENTVNQMETLGADRNGIIAIIGPTISQRNYEVGPEFQERFLDADPDYRRFFTKAQGDRSHFDLPAFGVHRLRQHGVGIVRWTRHCTYAEPDRFFSYRRSMHRKEADYGRLIAAIRL